MRPARQLKAVDFDQHRHVLRYNLPSINTVDEFKLAAAKIIGTRAGMLRPNEDRYFATFGSCFAANVGEALTIKGAKVYTTRVTEDVNSPYNNRILLERVLRGKDSVFADELQANTGVDYDEMRKELTRATDIIFTLGNIFRLVGANGHTLTASKDAKLVREDYAETVECLTSIVAMLGEYTAARLFISVSPIPISGYVGDEFSSVVEADCASKCQLVAAIRTLSGFTYVPTFEVFRWLAAHQHFPTFGSGRDNPRHLWGSHIGAVMGVLCA